MQAIVCSTGPSLCINISQRPAYHVRMRKHTTIDLDQDLVRQAAMVLGTTRTTDTVHAALADVVRRQRRLGLFDIAHDLDLAALDALRSDRVADMGSPRRRKAST